MSKRKRRKCNQSANPKKFLVATCATCQVSYSIEPQHGSVEKKKEAMEQFSVHIEKEEGPELTGVEEIMARRCSRHYPNCRFIHKQIYFPVSFLHTRFVTDQLPHHELSHRTYRYTEQLHTSQISTEFYST